MLTDTKTTAIEENRAECFPRWINVDFIEGWGVALVRGSNGGECLGW